VQMSKSRLWMKLRIDSQQQATDKTKSFYIASLTQKTWQVPNCKWRWCINILLSCVLKVKRGNFVSLSSFTCKRWILNHFVSGRCRAWIQKLCLALFPNHSFSYNNEKIAVIFSNDVVLFLLRILVYFLF
jgi:hypothetical protein